MSGPKSIYEGFVDFDTTQVGDDSPVDAGVWISAANNALHFADQASQVRVAISECTLEMGTPGSTREWLRIATFGPWDHRLDEDGVPYPMRFRLAGSATNTSATSIVLVVSHPTAADRYVRFGAYSGSTSGAFYSTSSTSAAWLTPVSGASTLLTFTAADAVTSTESTIAVGGASAGVEVTKMGAVVWGRATISVGVKPQLRGLYLAEYCGPVP